jgi:hypothetical protein
MSETLALMGNVQDKQPGVCGGGWGQNGRKADHVKQGDPPGDGDLGGSQRSHTSDEAG